MAGQRLGQQLLEIEGRHRPVHQRHRHQREGDRPVIMAAGPVIKRPRARRGLHQAQRQQSVLSVHRHHAGLLLVPMTLLNETYRREVLGALRALGDDFLEAFLQVPASELARRIHNRVLFAEDPARDAEARTFCLSKIKEAIAITKRLSPDSPSGWTLPLPARRPGPDPHLAARHGRPAGITQSSPAPDRLTREPLSDAPLVR
jgi:hypothetical protein